MNRPIINAIVTLKAGEEEDRRLWVEDRFEDVIAQVAAAPHPDALVTFARITAMSSRAFATQASNVLNVEEPRP